MRQRSKESTCLVARVQGKVCGSIELSEPISDADLNASPKRLFYISETVVDRSMRRKGIARALLKAAESFCWNKVSGTVQSEPKESSASVGLFLHVNKYNWAAIKLYLQEGFVEVCDNPMFLSPGMELGDMKDDMIMAKFPRYPQQILEEAHL